MVELLNTISIVKDKLESPVFKVTNGVSKYGL